MRARAPPGAAGRSRAPVAQIRVTWSEIGARWPGPAAKAAGADRPGRLCVLAAADALQIGRRLAGRERAQGARVYANERLITAKSAPRALVPLARAAPGPARPLT